MKAINLKFIPGCKKASFNWKGFLLLFPILICLFSFGQDKPEPLDRQENREILNRYENKANEFADKNINKIAIDYLQTYDRLLDSLYSREKEDTLAVIAGSFQSENKDRKIKIEFFKTQISQLIKEKTDLNQRYEAFLKNSIISFIIWLAIVLLLIRVRLNRLKKSKQKVEESKIRLNSIEESALHFEKFSNSCSTSAASRPF